MRTAGLLVVALTGLVLVAPASGQQRQGPGSSSPHPLVGTTRSAQDARARRCEESRKSLPRKLSEIDEKQQGAHEEWHRRNDRLSGGEWLRKHQAFHQQLQRQREQSRRTHLQDCDDPRRPGGVDRVEDRWRKDHDALERERDRFRGILGRRKNN